MLDGIAVHLLAGGIGGTVGAVLTCPLEVVKVRLQSSQHKTPSPSHTSCHHQSSILDYRQSFIHTTVPEVAIAEGTNSRSSTFHTNSNHSLHNRKTANAIIQSCKHEEHTKHSRVTIIRLLKNIVANEGISALYKGLGPTLVGVLPSRYFAPDSAQIYISSAAIGGFTASTMTNPIWYLKTRLQLDKSKNGSLQILRQIIKDTWSQNGVRGFYKGVTASYVGISETALNFLIYENLKNHLLNSNHQSSDSNSNYSENRVGLSKLQTSSDMFYCMAASACSKTIATTLAYPHEVVRTRLREEGNKYHGFVQTFRQVLQEDGAKGLYRGLATHYVRQVPNSCIMIGTYECVVFLLQTWGLAERED